MEVAEKLVRYSDNGSTYSVNFPEVALPPHPNHRLLHVHENRRVLSAINAICENQINIGSQFLQTSDTVGYVVIDVDRDYSEVALEKLSKIVGTVGCRVFFYTVKVELELIFSTLRDPGLQLAYGVTTGHHLKPNDFYF